MLDDFFVRALAAGIGVALVTGPLGCFIVWRRMAYFGATLSHSALLGIALALLLGFDPVIGIIVQSLIVVPALILLERHSALSSDTHLGILAHGTLAVGLVIIGFMSSLRVDLMGYLFGDILAVTAGEVLIATNGYTGARPVSALRRRVVPIGSYVVVTEPLPSETVERLIPRNRMLWTSRRFLNYFRRTPDNRILLGGRNHLSTDLDLQKSAEILRETTLGIFPELRDVRFTHTWTGAVTSSS